MRLYVNKFFYVTIFCFFQVKPIHLGSTHLAPLLTTLVNTVGPVLELGCGDFSTPLLHAACAPTKRYLLSAESCEPWFKLFLDLESDWHEFILVKNWAIVGCERHWSVVFVDHAPEGQRIIDIERLRGKTDIFVVHDTEHGVYNYNKILPTFKYSYTCKRYPVWTTVVSDRIDVTQFFNE